MKPRELKKELVSQGFQVYRILGSRLHLAERVRENLIMDSGVAVVCAPPKPYAVRVLLRAQISDHPGETEAQLFDKARSLAPPLTARGYREVEQAVIPVTDPTDGSKLLDTWYELTLENSDVASEHLAEELRAALAAQRVV